MPATDIRTADVHEDRVRFVDTNPRLPDGWIEYDDQHVFLLEDLE